MGVIAGSDDSMRRRTWNVTNPMTDPSVWYIYIYMVCHLPSIFLTPVFVSIYIYIYTIHTYGSYMGIYDIIDIYN